jgi:hypothetical protein
VSFPTRVIYIGFGVSNYRSRATLSGPIKDPILLYDALRLAAASTFLEEHSIVVLDPTGAQFMATIESAMGSCLPNDLLILYFSGHADFKLGHLELLLIDHPAFQGRCSIDRLLDTHRLADRPKVLLLLDCCYSGGAATALFKNSSANWLSNVEVLAPTAAYELAQDAQDGSPFAHALRQALGTLVNQNEPVTVNSLVQNVHRLTTGSTELQHLRADGVLDLNIAQAQVQDDDFARLIETTYQRIVTGRQSERETLWFALSDEPEKLTLEVFSRIERDGYLEPSWLVRRAMGSSLSTVKYLREQSRLQVVSLLRSDLWMNVAIGLNAAKRALDASTVIEHCISLLHSGMPMDVKWLAALYLNDVDPDGCIDWAAAVSAGFCDSGWGLYELTTRLKLTVPSDIIPKTWQDAAHQNDPIVYLLFMSELDQVQDEKSGLNVLKKYSGITKVQLLKAAWKLQSSKPRGMTSAFGSRKWLRSKLYGAWRQAISLDIARDLLGHMELLNRREFLAAVPKLVPSVPHRMAIFEGGTPDVDDLEYLCWAAVDPHPWVRRAFLEYLCRHDFEQWQRRVNELNWVAILDVNRDQYPGQIDLLLQVAATLRYQPASAAMQALKKCIEGLPANEQEFLRKALKNEGVVY